MRDGRSVAPLFLSPSGRGRKVSVNYLGIDVGVNGGLVLLSEIQGLPPIRKSIMPIISVADRSEVSTPAIIECLEWHTGPKHELLVVIESCSHHLDSAHMMRSVALNYGKLLGIIESRGYNVRRVLATGPTGWQRAMLGKLKKGETKPAAYLTACKIWPGESWLANSRCRVPHDGMIDAALIAEWARKRGLQE